MDDDSFMKNSTSCALELFFVNNANLCATVIVACTSDKKCVKEQYLFFLIKKMKNQSVRLSRVKLN